MITHFIAYGILGWSLEVLWTGFFSLLQGNMQMPAFTYIWMFFVYGSAVWLEPIHDALRTVHWFVRGTVWTLAIFGIEYATGWLLSILLGACPWDYSLTASYHINGLIRLDYIPVWFTVGLLFEKTHDFLDRITIY